jgi:hypothetical protein
MLENNPLLYNSYDSLQTPLAHPIIQNLSPTHLKAKISQPTPYCVPQCWREWEPDMK